jgi:hypothetical protein
MIDPILSLTFSVYSNKGTYALLLGSGVSRSTGIPTGWEITVDLIRKLANVQKEDCEPNPEEWYEKKYKKLPNYSEILRLLTRRSAEQCQLLRPYFEPAEEEKERGLKIPTNGHKAIAKLVASGYIKVIITTNFDRLMEKALEEVGVHPTVISTPDDIEGAIPLIHSSCTIIKVNGDYLDSRIKNTEEELERYDRRITKLLSIILDDFGLIVCGWSAKWDTALKIELKKCKNHRYTTYWTIKDNSDEESKSLIELRKAVEIVIADADSFFVNLEEKISSLDTSNRPHQLSSKVAIITVKKYLVDDKYRIALSDLVSEERERVYHEIVNNPMFSCNSPCEVTELGKKIVGYEGLTEILRNICITGCYWGETHHKKLWMQSFERLINLPSVEGYAQWIKLRKYPALLFLYSAGLSAILAGKYNVLFSLLQETEHVEDNNTRQPAILAMNVHGIIDKDLLNTFLGQNYFLPVSERLYNVLHETFREYVPDNRKYDEAFDRLEYYIALIYADTYQKEMTKLYGTKMNGFRFPCGRFAWKLHRYGVRIDKVIGAEMEKSGGNWEVLQAGFFDRSIERFKEVKNEVDRMLQETHYF